MKIDTQKAVLLGVLVALAVAIGSRHRGAEPAESWPRCEYFRCRACGGPASIDQDQAERWGCRRCRFSTFRLAEQFRPADRDDFATVAEFWQAQVDAGALAWPDELTGIEIYHEAGGLVD